MGMSYLPDDSDDSDDSSNPHDAVKRSTAEPGEVADVIDEDEEAFVGVVKNAEDDPEGLLIDWRAEDGEWLYAETFESYTPLIP